MADIRYLDIVCNIVEPLLKEQADKEPGIYKDVGICCAKMSDGFSSDGVVDFGYSDWHYRLAYVYEYMAANASLIESIFQREEQLSRYFDSVNKRNGNVRICVFGAGPGTEVLGVAGWIMRRNLLKECHVDFSLFEVVDGWHNSLQIVMESVRTKLGTPGFVTFDSHYCTKANLIDFQLKGFIKNYDVYVFSYILSEIRSVDSENRLQVFGKTLGQSMSGGARVIFLDRYKDKELTFKNICAIVKGMGISLSKLKYELIPDELLTQEWRLASEPRVSRLYEQIERWPRGSPKQKRNAIYAVVTKETEG